MSVDAVSTMQARIAQITSLVAPDQATVASDSTDGSADTDFASEYESALGAFSGSGSSASSSLSSSLTAMLGGGSFTTGVTAASSSLLGMFSNAVSSAATAATSAATTAASTASSAIDALSGVADKVSSSSQTTGQDLVDAAREYLGVKYVWGGESLSEGGLDCSGLVLRSLADIGVDGIPRVARDQGKIGTEIDSLDDAKAGDLLVFDNGSHIGIYIGDGKMIDAPHRGSYVQERNVYETPTSIRRVL
ncbi:C40 family peptidase [Demequina salsinemoris]|uniref:C40 family peptidase n=1 Tax=Demequina salsinemoris TaxID=577470 RepID=UPI0007860C6F|nr:C40 family peptidase [Demequina salsinemoris]